MTTADSFYAPRPMNRRALTVVILLHGAALTALVLAKGEEIVRSIDPPTKVDLIDETKPPPEKPRPQPRVRQEPHVTQTPPIIDIERPKAPSFPPPPPFQPTGPTPGPATGEAVDPAPSPPPPSPPPPRQIEPARARANLASYVSDSDYPAAAARAEEQGTTRFRLAVGPDGKVKDCTVTGSSGSSALDSATCRIMKARARFTPARDGSGNPTGDTVANAIRWVLPDG